MSKRDQLASLVSELCTTYRVDMEIELVDRYTEALTDIEFELVEMAVAELIKESDWMPKASEIRRAAKRIEAESSDKPAEEEHWRKDSYDCPTCRDTGYVSIWTPDAMRWALSQAGNRTYATEPKRRLTEAAAKCTCSRGQSRGGSAATYDERLQLRVQPGSVKTKIESLMKWANQWQPANYVSEFESY